MKAQDSSQEAVDTRMHSREVAAHKCIPGALLLPVARAAARPRAVALELAAAQRPAQEQLAPRSARWAFEPQPVLQR